MRHLLRRRSEARGVDPLGDQLGVARHRHQPEPRLGRGDDELAQEVAHVGLVAGSLAPENVGVDRDKAHVSSRQSASTRSADDDQV